MDMTSIPIQKLGASRLSALQIAFGSIVAVGFILVLIAVAAEPLGLGIKEDFFLFQWFRLPRRECAMLGAALIALPFVCALLRPLLPYWKDVLLVAISVLSILLVLEVALRIVDGLPVWPNRNLLFERMLV